MNFQVPVILIIYNRPDKTRQVFKAIKRMRPSVFFIIADGPKNKADELLCNEARKISEEVDWDTDLRIDFSDTNLGNAERTITGLNNAFNEVEEAVILEDDCVPHPDFFEFCNTLLHHYKKDEKVMHISGCNILQKTTLTSGYFFSKYILPPWGWATWRRAWQKFNPEMDSWQKHKTLIHTNISSENFKLWTDTFEYLRVNKVTWDIPWNIDIWANNGVGIIPSVNLISNIGFDSQATFTKKESIYAHLPVSEIKFPLTHPETKALPFDKEIEAACVILLKNVSP